MNRQYQVLDCIDIIIFSAPEFSISTATGGSLFAAMVQKELMTGNFFISRKLSDLNSQKSGYRPAKKVSGSFLAEKLSLSILAMPFKGLSFMILAPWGQALMQAQQ